MVEIQVKGWDQIERFLWKVVWLLAPWELAFPQIEFTACKRAGINIRHWNIASKQKHKYKTLEEIQVFFKTKAKIQDVGMTLKYSLKEFQKDRQGAGSTEHFKNPKREDKNIKCSN